MSKPKLILFTAFFFFFLFFQVYIGLYAIAYECQMRIN